MNYNFIPDTGEPVSNEGKSTHEEEEDGCTILRITVQLPGNTNESKEACCFKEANQSGGLVEDQRKRCFEKISSNTGTYCCYFTL